MLKNILRGLMSRYDIEEIMVMENDKIIFWGNPNNLLHPSDLMKDEAKRVLKSMVDRSEVFNSSKVMIVL